MPLQSCFGMWWSDGLNNRKEKETPDATITSYSCKVKEGLVQECIMPNKRCTRWGNITTNDCVEQWGKINKVYNNEIVWDEYCAYKH